MYNVDADGPENVSVKFVTSLINIKSSLKNVAALYCIIINYIMLRYFLLFYYTILLVLCYENTYYII